MRTGALRVAPPPVPFHQPGRRTCGQLSNVSMHTGCSTSMTHEMTAPLLTNMGAFFDLAPVFLSMVAVSFRMAARERRADST